MRCVRPILKLFCASFEHTAGGVHSALGLTMVGFGRLGVLNFRCMEGGAADDEQFSFVNGNGNCVKLSNGVYMECRVVCLFVMNNIVGEALAKKPWFFLNKPTLRHMIRERLILSISSIYFTY